MEQIGLNGLGLDAFYVFLAGPSHADKVNPSRARQSTRVIAVN